MEAYRLRGLGLAAAVLIAMAAWLAVPALASATNLTFEPYIIKSSLGKNTTHVAVGDLNRDGLSDIVAVNYTSGNASVFLGNGPGTFSGPLLAPVGATPKACVLYDMDGDGSLDLVVSVEYPNVITVLKGDGFGWFGAAKMYPTAHNEMLAVADLNGDGRPDIITVNDLIPGDVSVLLANTSGGFEAPQSHVAGPSPRSVAAADFDLDGSQDVVIAFEGKSNAGNVVQLWLGDGRGGLSQGGQWPGGTTPKSISTADFNNDGKPDFIVSSEGTDDVRLFLGDGAGQFTNSATVKVGTQPKFVLATDINLDGNVDAVAAGYISDDVAVMLGDGRGILGTPTFMKVGNGPKCVATADFNRDGRPDMVTADNDGSTIALLYSATSPPSPPGITDLGASPATFSPNADTYQDKTSISYTTNQSAYNTVAVYDRNGARLKTLKSSVLLPAGQQASFWDGKYTPSGGSTTYAPDGTYNVLVTVSDGAGNTAQASTPVIVDTAVSKIGVTYASFSPNGDGRRDTTTVAYTLKYAADVSVLIRDGSGAAVRTVKTASAQGTGSYTSVWDGRLDGGAVAPEGPYIAVVRAVNAVGTIESVKATTVDLTAPVVSNAAASPATFVPPATTLISYTSSEPGTASVSILNAAKATVRTLSLTVVSGANGFTWDGKDSQGAVVAPGAYSVRISINDVAQNKATVYPVVLSVTVSR